MQTREAQCLRPISMARLATQLGTRRLYRDIPATMLRDIPLSMMFFPMHRFITDAFSDEVGNSSTARVLLSGCSAGSTAAALSTPMNVVKTRVMAKTAAGVEASEATVTSGKSAKEVPMSQLWRIGQCFRDVIKQQGIRGLFQGTTPRILIISPLFGTVQYYCTTVQCFTRHRRCLERLAGCSCAAPAFVTFIPTFLMTTNKAQIDSLVHKISLCPKRACPADLCCANMLNCE